MFSKKDFFMSVFLAIYSHFKPGQSFNLVGKSLEKHNGCCHILFDGIIFVRNLINLGYCWNCYVAR